MPSYVVAALSISALLGCVWSLQFPPEGFHEEVPQAGRPMIVSLRRESVPVKREGQVVSFRTTYSGVVGIGSPIPQKFRMVFDTGSGHVVVPASTCVSESCLVHKRFNASASQSAIHINEDGSPASYGEPCDQIDIGFGTGEITGEFIRDTVCLGFDPSHTEGDSHSVASPPTEQTCLEMNVVVAVEMSTQPFKSFDFDGILGLGLNSLAISDDFSFFDLVAKSGHVRSAHFGVFLTEGDIEGEESEIAIGGYNEDRLLHPLAWSPVAMADLGYWQVRILAVRIDGVELDICRDGTCRGVVDTGTSHLGIPVPFDQQVAGMLAVDAGDLLDCRLARTPVMELELENINITLNAENYMRRLPLREGVRVGSSTGVALPPKLRSNRSSRVDASVDKNQTDVRRHCSPRIMPVNLPAPVGPKLFILGEPVLHRYYSVYDWKGLQVGFSLANNHRNTAAPGSQIANTRGELPVEVDRLLMQQSAVVTSRHDFDDFDESDRTIFVQLQLRIRLA